MINNFRLYDLFVIAFVQLVVATVLVLSPARNIDSRFRWTGSRITEVDTWTPPSRSSDFAAGLRCGCPT